MHVSSSCLGLPLPLPQGKRYSLREFQDAACGAAAKRFGGLHGSLPPRTLEVRCAALCCAVLLWPCFARTPSHTLPCRVAPCIAPAVPHSATTALCTPSLSLLPAYGFPCAARVLA